MGVYGRDRATEAGGRAGGGRPRRASPAAARGTTAPSAPPPPAPQGRRGPRPPRRGGVSEGRGVAGLRERVRVLVGERGGAGAEQVAEGQGTTPSGGYFGPFGPGPAAVAHQRRHKSR